MPAASRLADADARPDHHARPDPDPVSTVPGGVTAIDVTAAAGVPGSGNTRGWTYSAGGRTWIFADKTGAPNGVTRMTIVDRDAPAHPRQVKVTVQTTGGTYSLAPPNLPLKATVMLGDAADAAAGLCGARAYAASECAFDKKGASLRCTHSLRRADRRSRSSFAPRGAVRAANARTAPARCPRIEHRALNS